MISKKHKLEGLRKEDSEAMLKALDEIMDAATIIERKKDQERPYSSETAEHDAALEKFETVLAKWNAQSHYEPLTSITLADGTQLDDNPQAIYALRRLSQHLHLRVNPNLVADEDEWVSELSVLATDVGAHFFKPALRNESDLWQPNKQGVLPTNNGKETKESLSDLSTPLPPPDVTMANSEATEAPQPEVSEITWLDLPKEETPAAWHIALNQTQAKVAELGLDGTLDGAQTAAKPLLCTKRPERYLPDYVDDFLCWICKKRYKVEDYVPSKAVCLECCED